MIKGTKAQLVNSAYELFGRNGFHAIGLDRIIDDVGVSKQTFYNHFESKDDLIIEVLTHRHAVEMKSFADAYRQIAGDDPRDQLYATFDVLDAWFKSPEFLGCIFLTAAAEFPSPTDPAHRMAATHVVEIVELIRYLATLAGAPDPAGLAAQLAMLIEGLIAYRHTTADPKSIDTARDIGRMILDHHLPARPPEVKARAARLPTRLVGNGRA